MADQQLSWRKANAPSSMLEGGGGAASKASSDIRKETPSTSTESWRSRAPLTKSTATSHSRENSSFSSTKEGEIQGRSSRFPRAGFAQGADAGPAAPLNPLHIGHSKPLPHPSTYGGSDNWALTPTGSLPSLPGTPSKAMQSMGWQHIALSSEERQRESSGSRELSAARALLNRRNEELPGGPMRLISSTATQSQQRQSPKRPARTLQPSSPQLPSNAKNLSPISTNMAATGSQIRPISPSEAPSHFSTPSPNHSNTSPALRHRDSTTSVASSSLLSLGAHPLSHSRRASQVFHNSPSSSLASSSKPPGPGYLVYRPPHLRRKDSIHALKPKVAHYDRVRTPSLRGHSRSPDPSALMGRTSRDEGQASSEAPLTGRPTGRRRLSSLGSFNSSVYDDTIASRGDHLDSRSLFAKLNATNADAEKHRRKFSDASSYRPDESLQYDDVEERSSQPDDIDLSADDLMMQTTSLTDEFCLSRTASSMNNHTVVDIFEVGDRLGPGMMHDGLEISIAETSEGFKDQNADLTGSQLEVIKKLGEGSYAVVYLVKEVTKGAKASVSSSRAGETIAGGVEIPNAEGKVENEEGDETVLGSEDIYGTTLKATDTGRLVAAKGKEEEEKARLSDSEPKSFALKCLCKRDLSDEMLKVQRLEATIHQSIPQHPYIVTLYRTYETAEWLFLILEYCPGQDLFYWLEQANDTTNLGAETPMAETLQGNDSLFDGDLTTTEATPPSPSLLASTESRFLLSTRRLKLISRMFQQMCEAIAFCHDRDISHRDIKPENFIVEDTRGSTRADNIKVKLTDFGLAVAQVQCIDFDCGSKPYMSYECRNNSTKWYDPKQSDIWSLGIVLLNLIFHRNPFVEPNATNCPSFASYVEDPVRFLVTAFRGLKWESATFLAENVFCDVSEGMDEVGGPKRKRITAKEFGVWAGNLEKYMESPSLVDRMALLKEPGADEDITSPIWHSRSPTSSLANSLGASPAGGFIRANTSIHQELENMGIHQEEWENYGSLFPEETGQVEKESVDEEGGNREASPSSPVVPVQGVADGDSEESKIGVIKEGEEEKKEKNKEEDAVVVVAAAEEEHPPPVFKEKEPLRIAIVEVDEEENDDGESLVPPPSATSTTAGNPKRRKRGARKGRTMAKQELKRSQSVENLPSQSPSQPIETASLNPRDQMLRELAEASQTLAREMSKAMKRQPLNLVRPVNKDGLQPSASEESPTSDTTSSIVSSGSRASLVSRASTQYTNFSWPDQIVRRPSSVYSARGGPGPGGEEGYSVSNTPLTPSSASGAAAPTKWDSAASRRERIADRKSGLDGNSNQVGRAGYRPSAVLPAPPVLTNWRERNASSVSVSSSSIYSDVGSICSTASAPAALAARRQQQQQLQTTSSTSSSSSNSMGGHLKLTNSRGTRAAAASNLGTITERATRPSEKDLDASYLAEIFGGRAPQSSGSSSGGSRQRAKGHANHARDAGIKNGAMAAAAGGGGGRSNVDLGSTASNQESRPQQPSSMSSKSNNMQAEQAQQPPKDESMSSTSMEGEGGEGIGIDPLSNAAPRKKILGKFLLGVKNYNKGVKAAPQDPNAMAADVESITLSP